jgi:hypothetical protein
LPANGQPFLTAVFVFFMLLSYHCAKVKARKQKALLCLAEAHRGGGGLR